jgi:hypothetical protein
MNVNATVHFANHARLFLIDNFFSQQLDAQLFDLFRRYSDTSPDWSSIPNFEHNPGRMVYTGSTDDIDNHVRTTVLNQLNAVLDKPVSYVGSSMWIDLPGYVIPPHYDLDAFEHAVQIYMTDPTRNFEMMGTAFYLDPKQLMFEIPYRRNSGYLIDTAQNILHGLHHAIPPGFLRYSVYMRFRA